MLTRIRKFFRRENGAVTVDWVVLCAAAVTLAAGTVYSIRTANGGIGNSTANVIESHDPNKED